MGHLLAEWCASGDTEVLKKASCQCEGDSGPVGVS